MVSNIRLVYDQASLHRTVKCHLVFPLHIVKRQDVCDNTRVASYNSISFQVPFCVTRALSAFQCKVNVFFASWILLSSLGLDNTSSVDWLSRSIQLLGIAVLSWIEDRMLLCMKVKPTYSAPSLTVSSCLSSLLKSSYSSSSSGSLSSSSASNSKSSLVGSMYSFVILWSHSWLMSWKFLLHHIHSSSVLLSYT